ncbi:hypothetical protein CERZMDRAFT_63224 [Cercospora zeae-maydis SCOH1-5]|uniref:Phospholipase/carboxylesterase/thioesterase domain-containing protein n=1 Tax=Cercospora zeae-maydis SCOH1-5 TaxID=717836 RepID=A0A6A6F0Q3_9PEZI|nr:hypothetical protein CERZMDRAFT_63224 [Cercospora zeae-maydis SCOH1-5]
MGRLPTIADFPEKVKVDIIVPRNNDAPTNILILLHGLGDTHTSFTNLGKQMNLPETCCISIQAPQTLLDLGGYHWGDDIIFDNSSGGGGGIDADGAFKQTSELLRILIREVLVEKCEFRLREILLFGFGQGGMAALSTAVAIDQAHQAKDPVLVELGGVISIGAGLSSDAPASMDPKCRTPVLVCCGSDDGGSMVTRDAEDKLNRVFQHVEVKRYRRSGDAMPGNRDEMLPIMHFFSRRLRSVKGVPEGAIEISQESMPQ